MNAPSTLQPDRLDEALDLLCTNEPDGTSWGHDTTVDREGAKEIIEAVIAERVREALEQFRVFCYEKEALQAWDSTASNRQGWLDTKLREFTALASAEK